jgi:hypothetical protein
MSFSSQAMHNGEQQAVNDGKEYNNVTNPPVTAIGWRPAACPGIEAIAQLGKVRRHWSAASSPQKAEMQKAEMQKTEMMASCTAHLRLDQSAKTRDST